MKNIPGVIVQVFCWGMLLLMPVSLSASEIDFGLSIVPYSSEEVLLPEVKLRIESLDQLIPYLWDPIDPTIDFRWLFSELPEKTTKPLTPIFVFGEARGFTAPIPPLTVEKIDIEFYQPFEVGYIEYHPLDIPPERVLMEDYGELRGIVTYIPKAQVVVTSELTSKTFVLKEPGLQKGEVVAKSLPLEIAKTTEKEAAQGVGEIPMVADEKKQKMGTAGELAIILTLGFVLIFLTPFKRLFVVIMLIFLWIYYWQPVASFFAKLLF